MDALALRADEGRSKAAISYGQLPNKLSRRYPNGETRLDLSRHYNFGCRGKREN